MENLNQLINFDFKWVGGLIRQIRELNYSGEICIMLEWIG